LPRSPKSKTYSGKLDIKIGTMIEVPRAAVTANEIAEVADFFSFGTNDLTQTTFGIQPRRCELIPARLHRPRDPRGRPVPVARPRRAWANWSRCAVRQGTRYVNETIKLGICGEHGGDPASIHFCHKAGLAYVSCSPFRVPIARLAAAQAALRSA
jgi:pyruvate,orthophosphate dikinase